MNAIPANTVICGCTHVTINIIVFLYEWIVNVVVVFITYSKFGLCSAKQTRLSGITNMKAWFALKSVVCFCVTVVTFFYFISHTQLWYASLRSLFTFLKTGGSAAELSLKKEWLVSLTPVSVGVESSLHN